MEEGSLSNLSIGLIIGGIVCCCLIVALGICLFMKYRDDDNYTPEFQTAHHMSELGQVNDFATQSLPQVDTYQSSANSGASPYGGLNTGEPQLPYVDLELHPGQNSGQPL